MGSLWRKAKSALRFNLSVDVPTPSAEDDDDGDCDGESRTGEAAAGGGMASGAAFSEASSPGGSVRILTTPMPTPSSTSRWLFRSGSRSSKKTCIICLGTMKAGPGHALFTAECSHTFHFHCITSNVKYGNYICPICRAKWKEIPFRAPVSPEHSHGSERANLVNRSQEDVHMLPRADLTNQQHRRFSCLHASEPHTFNDDEPLNVQSETAETAQQGCTRTVEIKLYPEFSAIPQSASQENFTVLIHLEAPRACRNQNVSSATSQTSRAPVDLITVIDVSGSMAGTKLALLKRAMSFVIQNLGPLDRLSVIAFSSTARRLFHLQRMTDTGRQQALQAVNSLISCGGTNIAEGLRKGAKVIKERTEQNPVCSMILLSDGQDTYTLTSNDARSASITVGDLYADEDRNFLVSVNVPPSSGSHDMVLLKVCCAYRDVVCNESIRLEDVVRIQRPEVTTAYPSSVDVDRERNRVQAAEAMSKARSAAECGAFSEAVSILEDQRRKLFESLAGQSGDQLCLALDAELREMQERMATQQRYEVSGRAYLLSGLSSHSWQRATARGDLTDLTSLVHAYQTPSMVEMLHRSQTFSPSPRTPTPPMQPARSFSFLGPQPR
ncbi:hypothetical protein C4D60_Mb04t23880 [Musa balbisiana]|uniref:RING-type domain-containing protein n=1 Tax=Musa balbisiana TaxID=52838 RepID=A0A4S8KE93_MUSBA|nr:hypothetical protein C4D60_Mb04t23880 [Musa balbisiana]